MQNPADRKQLDGQTALVEKLVTERLGAIKDDCLIEWLSNRLEQNGDLAGSLELLCRARMLMKRDLSPSASTPTHGVDTHMRPVEITPDNRYLRLAEGVFSKSCNFNSTAIPLARHTSSNNGVILLSAY